MRWLAADDLRSRFLYPGRCKSPARAGREKPRDPRPRATLAARPGADLCRIPGPNRTFVRIGILKKKMFSIELVHSSASICVFDSDLRPMFPVKRSGGPIVAVSAMAIARVPYGEVNNGCWIQRTAPSICSDPPGSPKRFGAPRPGRPWPRSGRPGACLRVRPAAPTINLQAAKGRYASEARVRTPPRFSPPLSCPCPVRAGREAGCARERGPAALRSDGPRRPPTCWRGPTHGPRGRGRCFGENILILYLILYFHDSVFSNQKIQPESSKYSRNNENTAGIMECPGTRPALGRFQSFKPAERRPAPM